MPEPLTQKQASMRQRWQKDERAWERRVKRQRRELIACCSPCAIGDHILCDGGSCQCRCAEELDKRRVTANANAERYRKRVSNLRSKIASLSMTADALGLPDVAIVLRSAAQDISEAV